MSTTKKRQHVVPQLHLKHFAGARPASRWGTHPFDRNKLDALRGPGESYSDVILRLVEACNNFGYSIKREAVKAKTPMAAKADAEPKKT